MSIVSALELQTDDSIYFFMTEQEPLNNWSSHSILIWGKLFPTVEHAYQYKKFEINNPKHARKIWRSRSAWQAKQFSRQGTIDPKKWNGRRVMIMSQLLQAKYDQHEDVRTMLLATGTRAIVEHSFNDSFWGCGIDGHGRNTLGKIWMQLRDSAGKA